VFEGAVTVFVVQNSDICTEKTIFLKRGESAFLSERKNGESLRFCGSFVIFAALAP
jgi:hypothetical protein